MTQTLNLYKLHFGSDDAELDEKRGFLDKVFLKTSIYHRVREYNRELVIGRKGSGKSAIWLMLRKALLEEKHSVIAITPQSLSAQKIEKLRTDSISQNEPYILSWKYALLVKLSLELIKLPLENSEPLQWVNKFLRDNEEINKNAFERFIASIGISELKLNVFGVEGSLKTSSASSAQELSTNIEKFQDHIGQILIGIPEKQFFVLIDKVDEHWRQTEQSKNMIIGLIKAVHDLNTSLHHSQFILFLREDIYDSLIFNDSDKFHSLEERLVWEEKDLKHLLATRGKVSSNMDIDDVDAIWNKMFAAEVRSQPSFQYIVQRTMRRPRDIIQFCNNALAEAQNSGHSQIIAQDILKAEGQYSAWKLKDIVSEFVVQYPYLQDLLGIFQGFQAEFSRTDFEKRYEEAVSKLKSHEDIQSITANKMLQILYSIGFLGVKTKEITVFAFDDPGVVLAQQEKIVIHPVFHSALSIQSQPAAYSSVFDQRGQVVGNQYNVAGEIISGGNVSSTYYETDAKLENEIKHLNDLLNFHRRNKQNLEKQLARFGLAEVPIHLMNQIEDTNTEIENIQTLITSLGRSKK